jgi:DNA-binding transcriptional ArsR family regulator
MKRDFELVREILLKIEEKESAKGWIEIQLDGFTPEQISYHIKLLDEAGFIEARDASTNDRICWKPMNLTWEGHEFLDTARDIKDLEKGEEYFNKQDCIAFF